VAKFLFISTIFYSTLVSCSKTEVPYSQHCGPLVPETTPESAPQIFITIPFPPNQDGYFHGGEEMTNHPNSSVYYTDQRTGDSCYEVYKIEASLILETSGALSSELERFWLKSSSKLCMVGSSSSNEMGGGEKRMMDKASDFWCTSTATVMVIITAFSIPAHHWLQKDHGMQLITGWLCVAACRILSAAKYSDSSYVGDCSIRLSLRNTTGIFGQVWSNKTASDPGYFNRIAFQSYGRDVNRIPGLKYEYTLVEKAKKSCPRKKNWTGQHAGMQPIFVGDQAQNAYFSSVMTIYQEHRLLTHKTEPISFTEVAYYASQARESIWRMDLEIIMALISNPLVCLTVGYQILYVKKRPSVFPFFSLLMLVVLLLGHMIPLVINFEALFMPKQNQETFTLAAGGWLETNEFIVRAVTVVAFLLQFGHVMLAWPSKNDRHRPKVQLDGYLRREHSILLTLAHYHMSHSYQASLNILSYLETKAHDHDALTGQVTTERVLLFCTQHVYKTQADDDRGKFDPGKNHPSYVKLLTQLLINHHTRLRGHPYHGFWSKSTGKLSCGWWVRVLVTWTLVNAESLLLVFLSFIGVSTRITSLVTGALESLPSADKSTSFAPIFLMMFPKVGYRYTEVSEESHNVCAGGCQVPKGFSLRLPLSESMCSILSEPV
ncbi:LOW QUALITY PROTEIN: hypothetical protein Tsubulata_021810, partial [Turnera subulata]